MTRDQVSGGAYVLVAKRWRQVTSKPGEPLDYIQHREGDIVELNVEEARRLLKAGAVELFVETDDQEPEPEGTDATGGDAGGSVAGGDPVELEVPDGTIAEVLAWVEAGGVAEVPERAGAAYDAEFAKGEGARSSLLTQLAGLLPDDEDS